MRPRKPKDFANSLLQADGALAGSAIAHRCMDHVFSARNGIYRWGLRMTKAWISGAALAGFLLVSPSAHASTITLTGGDAGEGYAPLSSTFGALDFGGVGGFIVQSVNFTASNPNIAISSVSTSGSGTTD